MTVNSIRLKNYRNYEDLRLDLSKGLNVFYGENAQGKTNLLEAVYYCGTTRSFRGVLDRDLVRENSGQFEIEIDFFGSGRDQNISYKGGPSQRRQMFLNGVKKNKSSEMVGQIQTILFSPEHLNLIKSGPSERRKFIDLGLSQLKGVYFAALLKYGKLIEQKNSLLKAFADGKFDNGLLDVYNDEIAALVGILVYERKKYIAQLEREARKRHFDMSGGKEELGLSYTPSLAQQAPCEKEAIEEAAREELKNARARERAAMTCLYGAHRDNIEITINGKNARLFASQGQQRSCVLALKIGECEIFETFTGEYPVLLLDDIMSELDHSRQDYILNHILGKQVLITCCDKKMFRDLGTGRVFYVEAGRIRNAP